MSAYVIDTAHVDVLVRLALCGPADGERGGPFPLRWAVPTGELEPSTLDVALGTFLGRPVGDPRMVPSYRVRTVGVPGEDRPGVVSPSELGSILFGEAVRSVMHLYPDTVQGGDLPGTGTQWREPYRWTDPQFDLTCAEASAAIDGYIGQSSDHPDHSASEASHIIDTLAAAVLLALPGTSQAPTHWGREAVQRRAQATSPRRSA